MTTFNEMSYELLHHPRYPPGLGLSENFTFPHKKKRLCGKSLVFNEDIISQKVPYFGDLEKLFGIAQKFLVSLKKV